MRPIASTIAVAVAIILIAILRPKIIAAITKTALSPAARPLRATSVAPPPRLRLIARHRKTWAVAHLTTADMRLPLPLSTPPIISGESRQLPVVAMRLVVTGIT